MNAETNQHLWRVCAGVYLAGFPATMTREAMTDILEEGNIEDALCVWEAVEGESSRGVLKLIDSLYNSMVNSPSFCVVSPEWKRSAEHLATYVNYNGDMDKDYMAHLEEGNPREDHIAYDAHVVGEWDDLVWEQFQKDNEHEIKGMEEEEPETAAGEPGGIEEGYGEAGQDNPGERNGCRLVVHEDRRRGVFYAEYRYRWCGTWCGFTCLYEVAESLIPEFHKILEAEGWKQAGVVTFDQPPWVADKLIPDTSDL